MIRAIASSPLLPLARHNARTACAAPSYTRLRRLFSTESKLSPDQSASESSTPDSPSPPTQSTSDDASGEQTAAEPSQIDVLTKALEKKDAELSELNDRTLRTLAEMENVRMIARRDVHTARKYAVVPFAKDILSVADNLGLALGSVDKAHVEGADADPMLQGLHTGVGATESELLKVFSKHGISRYGAVGDKFDPNKYQALFEVPTEDHEPGTVISVQKLGYEMGERVLRPAEVGVSRAP